MNKTFLAVASLVGIATTGLLITTKTVSADDVVDEIDITVPQSCSMSGSGMDSHSANIANGTSNSSIGETVITATCNDANGFAIYAVGYSDNKEGKNVLTDATLGSTYDIATGTGTSGNSQWAMKVTTQIDPAPAYPIAIQNSFDSFHVVPDDYLMVAKRESATDIGTSAIGSTIKTTYQVYISNNQPAGTYAGQVKYVLVHPHDGAAPQKPIYMQDLNASNITSLLPNVGSTAKVYDNRDEVAYTIGKLADGNYWLLDNLALDLTNSTILEAMNEDNTNASNTTLNYLKGVSVRDPETDPDGKYATSAVSDEWGSNGSFTDPLVYLADKNVVPNDSISTTGDANGQYKVGGYYNLCAASAGSYCYSGVNHPDITINNATEDICPKGWRLPSTDEFQNLGIIVFGSTSSINDEQAYEDYRATLRLSSPGNYTNGVSNRGIFGGVWSSTKNTYNPNSPAIYYLDYARSDYSTVFTNYIANNNRGYSTRCVLDI